ncbi:hypothetical protein PPYR_04830 [Photinus pyralis]|uniref:Uncharacterized protein n=1 Tax=Photinus pyralis TaxID=7054 RepID=A0A5N4AZ86_PHOPY|nr:uncharacterized protein LOC116164744 [Photinus pyralis]KAB0802644.1 hypothetical protein PPYR_04830 [Photinus pyralis]
MGCNDQECRDRVYLPSQQDGVHVKDYLFKYIEREFPEAKDGKNAVYSIPSKFKNCGEKQASLAEEVVFTRLSGLADTTRLDGLWMTFFHSASYAGHSFRNQRVGKLMIREHDFVIFVKHKERYSVALAEVKSTFDGTKVINNVNVTSDAKIIKNNKRSAQHQLRDHMEVLQGVLEIYPEERLIECFIMWPFLSALTRDPKQEIMKRWKEDANLHVFENNLSDQNNFDRWFVDNIITSRGISEKHFITLLNRYIVLSCGVFVDEIHRDMLALLNREQLEVLDNDRCSRPGGGPLVVHGAAGTGKTLLVLRKLQQLFELGELNSDNRALYICYWPGIKCDFEQKLKLLGLDTFVDTARFYISQTGFLLRNKKSYKHIFMDEAEAICLSFDDGIMTKTLSTIFRRYHDDNCTLTTCILSNRISFIDCESKQKCVNKKWGELWFLVDINQASLFLPKHSPRVLKVPAIVLNKVMRSTGYIFNIFKQYYSDPMPKLPKSVLVNMNLNNITHGHHILGPPAFWVEINDKTKTKETVVNVVIDLCATKGFKPNDVCIIPFLVNDNFVPEAINEEIDNHFVENGYRPRGVGDVEDFISNKAVNDFLISWALRVKGLEFKVVLMVVEDDDYDASDSEDRRKSYIIASRCTCMLILISPKSIKHEIDLHHAMQNYPFNLRFI